MRIEGGGDVLDSEARLSHITVKREPGKEEKEETLREPLKKIQEDQKKVAQGELDKDKLKGALDKFNKAFDIFDIQLRFKIHEETKYIVVKVVDVKNNKVIREIPPEKLLDMFAKMMEFLGLLFDEKV